MLFEKVESKGLAQYSYIVGDGHEAVVIDPRRDCQIYVDLALKAGMRITNILETHRHEDFAVGSAILAQQTGAEIWHADPQLPYAYGMAIEPGQEWQIGSLNLKALHTPGHTEGSRSYVLYTANGTPWILFTGDVLFTGEVGRVDFLGMDRAPVMAGHLFDSIFNVLFSYGDGVIICPGHGYGSACGSSIADRPWSTIGIERRMNPRLQYPDRETFISNVSRKLPKPGYFSKMEAWNLKGAPPAKGIMGVQAYAAHEYYERIEDAFVIDLRSMSAFAGGHIPGAISIESVNVPSYIGWFVQPEEPILLVSDYNDINAAVTFLNRQGYDHILGYLSGGMLDWTVSGLPVERTTLLSPTELSKRLQQPGDISLIDVRSEEEFLSGALQHARNIPIKGFSEHIDTIKQTTDDVVLYCAGGERSIATISALQRAGHPRVEMLNGGLLAWNEFGLD